MGASVEAGNGRDSRSALALVLATGLYVLGVAMTVRAYFWSVGPIPKLIFFVARFVRFSEQDFWLIAGLTLVAIAGVVLAGRRWRVATAIAGVFRVVMVAVTFSLTANIVAARALNIPLTIQLVAQADFFRSFTARQAITETVRTSDVIVTIGAIALCIMLPPRLVPVFRRMLGSRRATLGMAAAFCALAGYYLHTPLPPGRNRAAARIDNPTIVFVESIVRRPVVDLLAPGIAADQPTTAQAPLGWTVDAAKRPTNVVLVVMESIGADPAYGTSEVLPGARMPTIDRLRSEGVTVTGLYAPLSSSTQSGYSIFSGRYSGLRQIQQVFDDPRLPRDGLAPRLKQHGLGTAIFMTGDLSYQDVRPYLSRNGFDHLEDMTTKGCSDQLIDDRCTIRAFDRWIAGMGTKPFFATIWTHHAHSPYYSRAARPDMLPIDRYRAAMLETDAAIALMVERLRRRGLLDKTLIVVVGDHGEAFNQHGALAHANSIYNEETHIPLVLRSPSLPAGVTVDRVASNIDLAPTILSMLGFDARGLRGADILGAGPAHRAFLAAFGRYMIVGYREGRYKYALDLTSGAVERYDMITDQQENHPAPVSGAERKRVIGLLAAWAQFDDAGKARATP